MKTPLKKLLCDFATNMAFYFSQALREPLAKPYWIYISLTHRCNLDCQMCGVKNILKDAELDLMTVKKLLEEIAGWNSDSVVLFTGGEIFLRDDIFDIIEYAVSLGLTTEIVSNGSRIGVPGIASSLIRSGLKNIAISLDGATAKTHDAIRGRQGAYAKALSALTCLSQLKKEFGFGPQLSVWTTIMKENVAELFDVIPLTKERGAECLVYHPVIATQDDMQNTTKEGKFWVRDRQLQELKGQIDKINAFRKEKGFVAFLHDPLLWIDYFQGSLNKKNWKCNPYVFINIGPDGNVRSCGQPFGNILEMTLSECLCTKEARKARDIMSGCDKPCLQTCWGKPEADDFRAIVDDFLAGLEGLNAETEEQKEALRKAVCLLEEYEHLLKSRS